MRNTTILKCLMFVAVNMLSTNPIYAVELDEQSGFRVSKKDAMQLMAYPKSCKKPASFAVVSMNGIPYKGTPVEGQSGLYHVDPRNWYQFIDLDGDGICEVEAEICNYNTASKHPERSDTYLCYSWESAFKYNNGIWIFDQSLHGGISGGNFRGAAAFKYFDKGSAKIFFTAYHDLSKDAAGPNFVLTYFGPPKPRTPGQGWPQSCYDSYDDAGPFQQNGAYIYLLDRHVQRLLSEYAWRVDQCGGMQGYRDADSRTISLEQLVDIISMFTVSDQELVKPRNMDPEKVATVKRWHRQVRKILGISSPGDSIDLNALEKQCASKGGYHDIGE